jgi:hypothetical protein
MLAKSASMAPGALRPVVQELKQLMQHEELLVGTSNPYVSALQRQRQPLLGGQAGLAAAGSASFLRSFRRDSANSSGASYSLPRNDFAGSADGRAVGALARRISRLCTEHKQVGYTHEWACGLNQHA